MEEPMNRFPFELDYMHPLIEKYGDSDLMFRLIQALEFYADEGTYHATAFFFDPPTGGFDEDFSLDEGSDYDYPKPGKKARELLQELWTFLHE